MITDNELFEPTGDDSPLDYWTTHGGVYFSFPALVIDDEVTVQCRKDGYMSVKNLLLAFAPVDHDSRRPMFTKTFRDSAEALNWWTRNIEEFLAGSMSLSEQQQVVVFGRTVHAMKEYAAWIGYLADHPDHDGLAVLMTSANGNVEVINVP